MFRYAKIGSYWLSPCLSLALFGSLWLSVTPTLALISSHCHSLAYSSQPFTQLAKLPLVEERSKSFEYSNIKPEGTNHKMTLPLHHVNFEFL